MTQTHDSDVCTVWLVQQQCAGTCDWYWNTLFTSDSEEECRQFVRDSPLPRLRVVRWSGEDFWSPPPEGS